MNNEETKINLGVFERFLLINFIYTGFPKKTKITKSDVTDLCYNIQVGEDEAMMTWDKKLIEVIDLDSMSLILNYYRDNYADIYTKVGSFILNNTLESIGLIKQYILCLAYVEIMFFDQNVRFVVIEYTYIAWMYGITYTEISFINKIIDNIYLQKQS